MSNIFTLENIDEFSEKINIDELYEKKRQHDVGKLELFNKILIILSTKSSCSFLYKILLSFIILYDYII